MFHIRNKQVVAQNMKRFDILAPEIAQKARPGHFVSLALRQHGSRLPLAVVDTDLRHGTITVIVHEADPLSHALGEYTLKDPIYSIIGPLGSEVPCEKKGTVVCMATGIGVAQMVPIARGLKTAGNRIIGLVGAQTKKYILLEAQMRLISDKLIMTTEDGSYERKGLATDILKEVMKQDDVRAVYAVGSKKMMASVATMTRDVAVPLTVFLNPMMVDCVGMCGSCRVKIGDSLRLACVDGPAFNGHEVDYDYYATRNNAYKEELWDNQESMYNREIGETKTFRKFLSGILKA